VKRRVVGNHFNNDKKKKNHKAATEKMEEKAPAAQGSKKKKNLKKTRGSGKVLGVYEGKWGEELVLSPWGKVSSKKYVARETPGSRIERSQGKGRVVEGEEEQAALVTVDREEDELKQSHVPQDKKKSGDERVGRRGPQQPRKKPFLKIRKWEREWKKCESRIRGKAKEGRGKSLIARLGRQLTGQGKKVFCKELKRRKAGKGMVKNKKITTPVFHKGRFAP